MLSTIIQFSTNEFKFLERNLEQSSKFSDEVVLCICDRFFDGSPEDSGLLEATRWIASRFPKCRVEMFEWEGENPNPNYYHNLSRKKGTELAKGDWLLFLDADEILDDSFGEWFELARPEDRTWCLSCYWYFRSPSNRSRTTEGCGLLIRKDLCKWDVNLNLERQQLFSLPNFRNTGLFNGRPLAHHFSWVRTKEEMLNKVSKWGHKNDREWASLVAEEFSRPFQGTDFVHGYQYDTVEDGVFSSRDELNSLLVAYSQNPSDSKRNFELALFYENSGHTASAMSYYLRTAERTENKKIQFECMIRASGCFAKQGSRNYTVKGLLQHALALQPKRPEGYYMLSLFHENEKSWQDSYMIASVGDQVADKSLPDNDPLATNVGYPGNYAMLFQKAVASWWCGLCDESRVLFKSLLRDHRLDSVHMRSVMSNLHFLKAFSFETYNKSQMEKFKFPFPGLENVDKNYSEAFQDLFVLSVLNGKRKGTYLEIGAGDPTYGSNTYLLESAFDWKGVSLDLDEKFVEAHKKSRRNDCALRDATNTDYGTFLSGLGFPNEIDYLQLDCDPPSTTFRALTSIPLEKYKFAVVTYEHDIYCDETKSFQEMARKYLESYGYFRVLNNVSPDEFRSYEDWWVHPDLVDMNRVREMCKLSENALHVKSHMLKG